MRMTICRSSWMVALAAGALSAPAALSAQQDTTAAQPPATEPRTHLVRTGDTLWEIARIHLGDPFLWPEIYRVNTAVIEDPHWIFPGEALAIPDGFGTPTVVAEAPQDSVTTVPQQTNQPSLIFAPANRGTDGPTVFSQHIGRRTATGPTFQGVQEVRRTAVRLGEFRAAPWVDRNGGPRGNGRIVASTEMPGIAAASDKIRYTLNERIYMLPPERTQPRPGDRYLTYRVGPAIHGLGQVMIPTGIVRVEEAYQGEKVASVARILAQYDVVMEGDGVMPLEPFDMDSTSRVAAADVGVSGRVVWIQGEPVLPSLQRYLVVDASARDGVRLGDQLTLVRPTTEIPGGVTLPEQEIAIAQVVRVTDFGITAMILDQTQPAIKPGTLARVTGRLP